MFIYHFILIFENYFIIYYSYFILVFFKGEFFNKKTDALLQASQSTVDDTTDCKLNFFFKKKSNKK